MKRVSSIKEKVLRMKDKAFTLIELLVVISIIGLLSGLVISNVAGVRERARDVQRKSDLDQMKKALRMYYNDNNAYIPTASFPAAGGAFNGVGSMVYMKVVPGDPSTTDSYRYYRDGTCVHDFRLFATLENKSDPGIASSQQKCSSFCGAPASEYVSGNSNYVVCAD